MIQKQFKKVSNIFEHIQPSLMKWLTGLCSTASIIDHKDLRFSILQDGIVASVKARKPSAGNNALEIVTMLMKINYQIDHIMITDLLSSLVEADKLDNSLELLNMMLKINIPASNGIYEELIGKLLRRKQLDLCIWMIKYLHSKNYLVSIELYTELITALIQNNNINGINDATSIIKEVKRISPVNNSGSKILSDL